MAAKKQGTKAKSAGLWLGAFSLLESGRGEASFQIIGSATDAEDASRVFALRVLHLRETTTLFDAESSVYLDAIIDLSPGAFPVATLVNWVARKQSSESDMWSPVPEQPDSRAEIYGWGEDDDGEKVIDREPFLEFAKRAEKPKAKMSTKSAKSAKGAASKPAAAKKSKPAAGKKSKGKAKAKRK